MKTLKRNTEETMVWFITAMLEGWGVDVPVYAAKRYRDDEGGDLMVMPAIVVECARCKPDPDIYDFGVGIADISIALSREPRDSDSDEHDDLLGRIFGVLFGDEIGDLLTENNEAPHAPNFLIHDFFDPAEESHSDDERDIDALVIRANVQHFFPDGFPVE